MSDNNRYSGWQERVIDEQEELNIKYKSLRTFIRTSDVFKELDSIKQAILMTQAYYMSTYLDILKGRVAEF